LTRTKKTDTQKIKEETAYKLRKGRPHGIVMEIGQTCKIPLKDQLFPEEWHALQDLKTNYEICKNFSDEFLMASLFARKLDLVRTHNLLQSNWKWRVENNFVILPKFSEIPKEYYKSITFVNGARTKDGSGILYFEVKEMEINKGPWTMDNLMKWIAWYFMIGMFSEGMDYFRNGVQYIQDLQGYSWKQFDLDFQKKGGAAMTDHFPARIKGFLILNPPAIFNAFMKIMKTIIKTKLMDRVEIVTLKELQKYADKDNLRADFGGNIAHGYEETVAFFEEWVKENEDRLRIPAN